MSEPEKVGERAQCQFEGCTNLAEKNGTGNRRRPYCRKHRGGYAGAVVHTKAWKAEMAEKNAAKHRKRVAEAKARGEATNRKVREELSTVIPEVFDREWLLDLARSIKKMTHGAFGEGTCPDCGSRRRVQVRVPDIKGQIAAVTELIEQAEGRPGTNTGESGGVTLIIERRWPDAGVEDLDELRDAAQAASVSPVES